MTLNNCPEFLHPKNPVINTSRSIKMSEHLNPIETLDQCTQVGRERLVE